MPMTPRSSASWRRSNPTTCRYTEARRRSAIAELGVRFDRPVIKSIKVRDADDITQAVRFGGAADMFLFDAKAPEDLAGALPGGNGVVFDWSLLGGDGELPRFMLSGGLTIENVARALEITGARIVDVSTGVETAPGVKDAGLIRKFIEAAKRAR